MATSRFGDLRLYRRLADQARSSWRSIVGLFLLSLLASPLALLAPMPLKIAVDSVLNSRPLPGFLRPLVPAAVARSPTALLLLVAALAVLITLLSQLQSLARAYLTAAAGERLVLDVRARISPRLQGTPLCSPSAAGRRE